MFYKFKYVSSMFVLHEEATTFILLCNCMLQNVNNLIANAQTKKKQAFFKKAFL